jgi:ribonuclease J
MKFMNPAPKSLKILSLGGAGFVTSNMFVYETPKDIIIIDCGIGFPDEDMLGIDLLLPDIAYLKDKISKIRAILLTHGHDDHLGGLPFILPQLSLNIPIFAPRLAAAFAQEKLDEFSLKAKINIIDSSQALQLGDFTIDSVRMPHSIPDSLNFIIHSPVGTVYHAADFKFDFTPVDKILPETGKIALAGQKGILCLLIDCLRSEKEGFTPSESTIKDSFEREITTCPGKFIITTFSSNISRIQQAIDVAHAHHRKVCFLGLSMGKNTSIKDKQIKNYPPSKLCLIVAGSQAQVDSALYKITNGESKYTQINDGDKVIFSSDYIPGNENNIRSLIDTLSKKGAIVCYRDILDDLHVSGHASQGDLLLMIGLTKPKFLSPIGGTYRHMKQFENLSLKVGYQKNQILLPDTGQAILFNQKSQPTLTSKIPLRHVLVDGLGVGDVGHAVLRDRQVLAEEGIVVAVIPLDQNSQNLIAEPEIISRGFVYIKESKDLITKAQKEIKRTIASQKGKIKNYHFLRKEVESNLERLFYKETNRRPMVLTFILEI